MEIGISRACSLPIGWKILSDSEKALISSPIVRAALGTGAAQAVLIDKTCLGSRFGINP